MREAEKREKAAGQGGKEEGRENVHISAKEGAIPGRGEKRTEGSSTGLSDRRASGRESLTHSGVENLGADQGERGHV